MIMMKKKRTTTDLLSDVSFNDYHFCFSFMCSQFQIALWRPTAMKDIGGFSQVLQECA